MKRLRWWAATAAVATAGFVALIGFAHTPAGRPVLPYLTFIVGQPKSCPLGYDKAQSSEDRRRHAAEYISQAKGQPLAATKTVLDFTLGRSTSSDVKSYANTHSGHCRALTDLELECSNIRAGNAVVTLWASFGERGQLIRYKSVETLSDVRATSDRYAKMIRAIGRDAGRPTRQTGSYAASSLASGALYQAISEFKYRNYLADLRVTNLGSTFAITTHFFDPEGL